MRSIHVFFLFFNQTTRFFCYCCGVIILKWSRYLETPTFSEISLGKKKNSRKYPLFGQLPKGGSETVHPG